MPAGLAETEKGLPAQHHQEYCGEDADQGPRGIWFTLGPHSLLDLPCDSSSQAFQQKEDFNCFEEEGER